MYALTPPPAGLHLQRNVVHPLGTMGEGFSPRWVEDPVGGELERWQGPGMHCHTACCTIMYVYAPHSAKVKLPHPTFSYNSRSYCQVPLLRRV